PAGTPRPIVIATADRIVKSFRMKAPQSPQPGSHLLHGTTRARGLTSSVVIDRYVRQASHMPGQPSSGALAGAFPSEYAAMG
ncbi:MAG TPA: hypothetical protein VKX24_07295, partial [Acidimicrobiia bacterium]|nr:hypothetical protein [Acidimicrobiia bacterium]